MMNMLDTTRPRAGRRAHVALMALALLVLARPASATIVAPADFDEMVAESELIVHGRVVAVQSRTTAGRRTIESVVTVSVMSPLKGAPGRTVVFRVPNGQVGRYRRIMVGAPTFAEGDEVVLFLSGRPPAIPMVFGLSQGVYRVQRGADGRAMVQPPVGSEPGRVVRGDPARRPMPVDAFARQVSALVERQP